MIRFAVIGTNWISHAFCKAAHETGKLTLQAVYSRKLETAQGFAAQYDVTDCYDNLEELAEHPDVDAVYIASPNAFHAPQAEQFIRQGKHVIGEKPLASNLAEVDHLIDLAKAHNVVLFEAMKTRYLPNMEVCKKILPELGRLRRAHFSYCQYSSRYPLYLKGENPNTFRPEMSNGSLIDIGIYPLTAAVELLGSPGQVTAHGQLLDTGVDAHGTLILHYPGLEALVSHSKVSDGINESEIQGEEGTLRIHFVSELHKITLQKPGQAPVELTVPQAENSMFHEALAVADLIEKNDISHDGLAKSREVSRIITNARRQIGITYPADQAKAFQGQ